MGVMKMNKLNNNDIDIMLETLNNKYDSNIIRISNYEGSQIPIKLYNQDENHYFYERPCNIKRKITMNRKWSNAKICSHSSCSYKYCIYQKAEELEEVLKDIYINSNNVQQDIANLLNISKGLAKHIILKLGLNKKYKDLRINRIYKESYCYNPFIKMDANAHWLLGYILADGCIFARKKCIKKTLNITSKDIELLQYCCDIFKIDFEENVKIKIDNKHNSTYYSLNIVDNNICDSLIKLGIQPRKSFSDTNYINLVEQYKWDFLRGLFDGDGSIRKGEFNICGHSSYLKFLQENYFKFTNFSTRRKDNLGFLKVHKKAQLLWLYNKLYYNKDIPYLERKREIFYENIKGLKLDRVKELIYTNEQIHVCDLTTNLHTFNANDIWTKNCDFNAEEIRIPALWSKEPAWLNAFKDHKDVHKSTACAIWGEENYTKDKRKMAKGANFGLLYGMTAHNFKDRFNISYEEAQEFVDQFKAGLPVLFKWIRACELEGEKNGTVYTMFGRPRRVKSWFDTGDWSWVSFAKRTCVNTKIQGTGADILKIVFLKLFDTFYKTNLTELVRFKFTIHD